ncbi:MAG: hypothetical protein HZA06_06245 [Nitrospirae bacterium]|nr:hypothetical protein [Nitrospirota bacterium]
MDINDNELKKGYRIAVIIGIAMIASVFVYAVIVELIKSGGIPFKGVTPFPKFDILRYVLFGIAIFTFFIIRLIRSIVLSNRAATPQPAQGQPSFLLVQKLVMASVITYALCESVAIYGLVLFFMALNSNDFYIFMIISLIYFAVYFPRYSQWEEWSKKA